MCARVSNLSTCFFFDILFGYCGTDAAVCCTRNIHLAAKGGRTPLHPVVMNTVKLLHAKNETVAHANININLFFCLKVERARAILDLLMIASLYSATQDVTAAVGNIQSVTRIYVTINKIVAISNLSGKELLMHSLFLFEI